MMMRLGIGTMMLAVGLIVGSGATVVFRQPAVAEPATGGMNMEAQSKSTGDTQMNAAMDRMMQKTSAARLTGIQDRDFMTMMIPHHQSAVDMAKIELRRGTHSQLKALAQDIIKSQDREIVQMHAWLKAWYGRGS